jgi:hypothetical protein
VQPSLHWWSIDNLETVDRQSDAKQQLLTGTDQRALYFVPLQSLDLHVLASTRSLTARLAVRVDHPSPLVPFCAGRSRTTTNHCTTSARCRGGHSSIDRSKLPLERQRLKKRPQVKPVVVRRVVLGVVY